MSFTSSAAYGLCSTAFGTTYISPGTKVDSSVTEVDPELAFEDKERFISMGVSVPHEITLNFNELELVVVHFGDDPGDHWPSMRESFF